MENHNIKLTQIEVDVLKLIIDNCGGCPTTSLRGITDSIHTKILACTSSAHIENELTIEDHNLIYFRSTDLAQQAIEVNTVIDRSALPKSWQ